MRALQRRWQALLDADSNAPALISSAPGDEPSYTRAAFEALVHAQVQSVQQRGVGDGDVIAWLGNNSARMLALLLACERIGVLFAPLNWRLATAELQAIVVHAGASWVFSDPAHQGLVQPLNAALQPARVAQADDLLLAYTSGTTGQAKGAVHTSDGMAANIDAAVAVQGLDGSTRTLAVLPLFHVGGLCIQTLPTLLSGGVVIVQPRFDAQAWFDAVAEHAPTTSLLVPATMRALTEHPAWPTADLQSLNFVNSGSSIVPLPLIEAFHARGVPVAQVYGATETGPVSIALRPGLAMQAVGSVGEPAPGVTIRLVDAQGRDVPDGQAGEVWVRGANVMRGYHRVSDPASFDGQWFHSGDLACRDAQGRYTVVGRSKELIISGGENIYPAEIENLVASLPGVADCAVVGMPDPRWGEVPWLAVVARPGAAQDDAAVRASYETRLARFKHPQRVVWCESLPKTALGKVRRNLLTQQLLSRHQST
jgi:fatty-acyl-CoA synthase